MDKDLKLDITPESDPKLVFVVPYRDRAEHKHFFQQYMDNHILTDISDSIIYFVHQCDERPFNRGAMKNIGFLEIKRQYPDSYRNMTFVFNDVDTVPCRAGSIDYHTTSGVVKHFYGFKFALGGFFSINGGDFEKTNGFPNYWGWGLEDNAMNDRVLATGIRISRDTFYPIGDMNVIHLSHGTERRIAQTDINRYHTKQMWGTDGLNGINNINVVCDGEMMNVRGFNTTSSISQTLDTHYLNRKNANKLNARFGRPRGKVKMFL